MRTNRPLEPGSPPPFFVKWDPSNRGNGKNTRANQPKEVLVQLDLLVYIDPSKVKNELWM